MLNELKNVALIVLSVICFLFLLRYSCDEASAESAIVSFNNAEHLVAVTDSVVGVCDTVKWEEPPGPGMDYQWCRITCRELVCVTADWPRTEMKWLPLEDDYPKIYLRGQEINIPMEWRKVFIPGEAIIFYEEVKQ